MLRSNYERLSNNDSDSGLSSPRHAPLDFLDQITPTPRLRTVPKREEPKVEPVETTNWLQRFFRKHHHTLLYIKTIPSMLLLGTFGRRPLTIAKLAAPAVVDSFAAFVGPLLGPILFLALVDTLFIGIAIFQEIKELEWHKMLLNKKVEEKTPPPEQEVEALRAWIDKQPEEVNTEEIINTNIFTASFRNYLREAEIHPQVFIKQLIATNQYESSPHNLAKALLEYEGPHQDINYIALWLESQFDLTRLMFQQNREYCTQNDQESQRVFILNNIASPKLRSQLSKLDLDENQFVEYLLQPDTTAESMREKFRPGIKTWKQTLCFWKKEEKETFNYAEEWLKTEIRLVRKQPQKNDFPRLDAHYASRSNLSPTGLVHRIRKIDPEKSRYEYDANKIVKRFDSLSTNKEFKKEYPKLAWFTKEYEFWKKILVFPLRSISLGLAVEALFPFAFPLMTSILLYSGIGLALSLAIVTLENHSDRYLQFLKGERQKEQQKLHQSNLQGTLNGLSNQTKIITLEKNASQFTGITRSCTAPGNLWGTKSQRRSAESSPIHITQASILNNDKYSNSADRRNSI